MISNYSGYSFRRGVILTQEILWSNQFNMALSSGVSFKNEAVQFIGSNVGRSTIDAVDDTENITREASGTYIPTALITSYGRFYLQLSYDFRIQESIIYSLTLAPAPKIKIPSLLDENHSIDLGLGMKF